MSVLWAEKIVCVCEGLIAREREREREQRTLTVGGSIIVRLVSYFTSLDSAASLHTKKTILSSLVKSSLVKLETSCTVILLFYKSGPTPASFLFIFVLFNTILQKKL